MNAPASVGSSPPSPTWRREPWRCSARVGEVLGLVEHPDLHARQPWRVHVVLPWGGTLSGRARDVTTGERAVESVMRAAARLHEGE
ncbi:hypothetical protein L6R50_08995 [Myxococcota bacterium]|nr:hypothetical protein [Myxococcota bacterium]